MNSHQELPNLCLEPIFSQIGRTYTVYEPQVLKLSYGRVAHDLAAIARPDLALNEHRRCCMRYRSSRSVVDSMTACRRRIPNQRTARATAGSGLDIDQCAGLPVGPLITLAELVGGLKGRGGLMAIGYNVTKTAGTLAGKPVLAVHVVRDEGNGNAEMVRIPCPDTAEQDRIAAELVELLNEVIPKS